LAADVAGYSWLTGIDEEGTHAKLQGHLRLVVDPKIAEHLGRVVKNTGDGLLAEFSSVLDAVRCAVEIQRNMATQAPATNSKPFTREHIDRIEPKRVGAAQMLQELRVLAQPGAIVAITLVLLIMAAGDLAILLADKGWPF
jgi:hypothetical protein